jgi:hypothetical protein
MEITKLTHGPGAKVVSLRMHPPADVGVPGGSIFLSLYRFLR